MWVRVCVWESSQQRMQLFCAARTIFVNLAGTLIHFMWHTHIYTIAPTHATSMWHEGILTREKPVYVAQSIKQRFEQGRARYCVVSMHTKAPPHVCVCVCVPLGTFEQFCALAKLLVGQKKKQQSHTYRRFDNFFLHAFCFLLLFCFVFCLVWTFVRNSLCMYLFWHCLALLTAEHLPQAAQIHILWKMCFCEHEELDRIM